ncbi:hypothetical protein POM88_043420 [Heracleum sosnowskyi]|uniref:Uncharacterized protein n=1 Tax=Heracleum sosnowskyi TaxID=360622 RepID=A0AAD8H3P0_9APIA|nr:hypothetical protein POM88_043420 [Heracleum sosnowskyi]
MPTMQIFFTISLLFVATLTPIQAVYDQVINNGTGTPGGTRFDNEIGITWSAHTLKHASRFKWRIFQQQHLSDREVSGLRDGFVADQLNGKMKESYSDDYFVQILGKSVDDLWMNYKAKYNTT